MLKKPDWLKVKMPSGNNYKKIADIIKNNNLHTVCKEANCPNMAECFCKGTATFLILGEICTRNCKYCNIVKAKPKLPNNDEPKKVAIAIKKLNLKYAVITSVTRDDLPDYGAKHFFQTINQIKKYNPECKIEILTPDFKGNKELIKIIIDSEPFCFNHNIETVKSLFKKIRPQGSYQRSLQFLKFLKKEPIKIKYTKSGFMIGLGENLTEIKKTLIDLKNSEVDIITIGQYLQPRKDLYSVKKYYTPKEFQEIKKYAESLNFKFVFASPLVRSSYMAEKIINRKNDKN